MTTVLEQHSSAVSTHRVLNTESWGFREGTSDPKKERLQDAWLGLLEVFWSDPKLSGTSEELWGTHIPMVSTCQVLSPCHTESRWPESSVSAELDIKGRKNAAGEVAKLQKERPRPSYKTERRKGPCFGLEESKFRVSEHKPRNPAYTGSISILGTVFISWPDWDW